MSPLYTLSIALGIFIAGLTAGITIENWRHGSEETAMVSAELVHRVKAEKSADAVATTTEKALTQNELRADAIIEKEKADVTQDPNSYSCSIPAASLRALSDLAASRSTPR